MPDINISIYKVKENYGIVYFFAWLVFIILFAWFLYSWFSFIVGFLLVYLSWIYIQFLSLRITFDINKSKLHFITWNTGGKITQPVTIDREQIKSWGIKRFKIMNDRLIPFFECKFKNGKKFVYPLDRPFLPLQLTMSYEEVSLLFEKVLGKSLSDTNINDPYGLKTIQHLFFF